MRKRFAIGVVLLMLLGAALRLAVPLWDGAIAAHPDERNLVGLAEGLRWPGRLNPLALDPYLPYGHLPLYLIAALGGSDPLLAARLLTGLLDAGTVALTAALGRRLAGPRVGVLAGAFLAVAPLHVQQAHFATVDVWTSFFTAGAVLLGMALAERGRRRGAVLCGLWAGLALGCKASAALLVLPLAAACAAAPGDGRERAGRALLLAGVAAVIFFLTNPFAVLNLPRYLSNLAAQAALVRGAAVAPYTIQYRGTLPYVYPIAQQLIWGMGPALGVLAFGGLGLALWDAVQRPPSAAGWVGLSWALPYFAFVGGLTVKFPRYLLPLTPLLVVYGAQATVRLWERRPVLGVVAAVGALLPAGLLSLSLVLCYGSPHPWVAASHWLRDHVPPGSVIAVEEWDHPLPLDASGYDVRTLPVFDPETDAKWEGIEGALAEADVVVIASRRGYGALAARPEAFPRARAHYEALLSGALGFRTVACFGRWPAVGPLALADDPFAADDLPLPASSCRPDAPVLWLPRLDESYVVYDRPLTVILQR